MVPIAIGFVVVLLALFVLNYDQNVHRKKINKAIWFANEQNKINVKTLDTLQAIQDHINLTQRVLDNHKDTIRELTSNYNKVVNEKITS